jgi:hypothetical protein
MKTETITPDITTFLGWNAGHQDVEMTDANAPLVVGVSGILRKIQPLLMQIPDMIRTCRQ